MARQRNIALDEDANDIVERHRVKTGFGLSAAVCDLIRKGWRLENLDEVENALIPIVRESIADYAGPAIRSAELGANERTEELLAAIDDVKKLIIMEMHFAGELADHDALLAASVVADDVMDGVAWT